MKKQIFFYTTIGACLLTPAHVSSQTCTQAPTCSELGYTKTASECTNKTMLKCPFDQTKIYCPSDTETLKTYAVGDSYVKDGIALGIVVTINATGTSGTIITPQISSASSLADATSF